MTVKKVTQEQIDSIFAQASFEVMHRIHGKQCIVVAKLPNGFTVVGESACVDPTNYDEQIGFDLAVKQIKNRLWELEGYVLQSNLHLADLATDFGEQAKLCDFQDKHGHKLEMNQGFHDLFKALFVQDGYQAKLHEGESVLTATQAQTLKESTALLTGPLTLQQGHVRYSGTTYVGDVSEDLTVEGSADDVIKVLKATQEIRHDALDKFSQ